MVRLPKYYHSVLVAVALPVILAALFGLLAGAISVFSLLAGATIGAHYVASEVIEEMEKVRQENAEKPLPFM